MTSKQEQDKEKRLTMDHLQHDFFRDLSKVKNRYEDFQYGLKEKQLELENRPPSDHFSKEGIIGLIMIITALVGITLFIIWRVAF